MNASSRDAAVRSLRLMAQALEVSEKPSDIRNILITLEATRGAVAYMLYAKERLMVANSSLDIDKTEVAAMWDYSL